MADKLNVKLTYDKREQEEIEVALPIYRAHYLDSTVIYARMSRLPDGRILELSLDVESATDRVERIELEYHRDPLQFHSSRDYLLGEGMYSCDPQVFERFLTAVLDAITPPVASP